MADGDDREENEHNQREEHNIPQIADLEIAEYDESEDIEQEYLALDSQLNQLDACLDSLEARNDDLLSRLKAVLQAGQSPQHAHSTDQGHGGDHADDGEGAKDSGDTASVQDGAGAGASGGSS